MSRPTRSEHHLNLNYLPHLGHSQPKSGSSTAATTPTESLNGTSSSITFPFTSMQSINPSGSLPARGNAGSPSHDFTGSRLFPKRAREIQVQEGLAPQVWGPPTSGHSTPLRETIPESPNADNFPDLDQGTVNNNNNLALGTSPIGSRTRAGTLPSRFSPGLPSSGLSSQTSLLPKTSRPTPSTSPFKPSSLNANDSSGFLTGLSGAAAQKSALMSRLRAGSMPQRTSLAPPGTSPFGSSIFSPQWPAPSSRDRSHTFASIRSSDAPSSPAQSHYSRDSLAEGDVKTLDYLGLADTPKPIRNQLGPSNIEMLLEQQRLPSSTAMSSLSSSANRFRSYSVNAKEKYADDEDDQHYPYSGQSTPAESFAAIAEAVRQHNLEVQAFANYASATRPRARTAGVLDAPASRTRGTFMPHASQLNSAMTAADFSEGSDYSGLTEAVHGLHLGAGPALGLEQSMDVPTRALWLGNIPTSTTDSSLEMIFAPFGKIESTRVLTQKNCGFVNYVDRESAMNARSQLDGKEIFAGAGPLRIGFAKAPSASGTPGHTGPFPSLTPDPIATIAKNHVTYSTAISGQNRNGDATGSQGPTPQMLSLVDMQHDIIDIVKQLGATEPELARISEGITQAILNDQYRAEIDPIPEPSHNRIHDAPRLRDIRKRIDNQSYTPSEIEAVAMEMLPEIAELSSDYLGNTVVQKLFEFCDEPVKAAMLDKIAPHLAEIGVHKNGTWAAQKIIDVSKSQTLQAVVVDALRRYSVPLFLDQFGNYVIQGCLRFGAPLNNFIFDTMLSRTWDLAQGRFGARAMRACLESHHATKDQQRMVAATIALHSVQLATNANGALLLTWFLDTCTFPRRRSVLAQKLVPHLVQLCTHKVAYLTVLKIINQRNEPEARDIILKALFLGNEDHDLTDILSDQTCGATLIFKILATPFFDEEERAKVITNVRTVLLKIRAQPQQGYKRLMDEVGLSVRGGGVSARDQIDHRAAPRHGNTNGNGQSHQMNLPGPPSVYNPMMTQSNGSYDMTTGLQRTDSLDSASTFENLTMGAGWNGMAPMGPTMGYAAGQFSNAGMSNQYTPLSGQATPFQHGVPPQQSHGQRKGRQGFAYNAGSTVFQPSNPQAGIYPSAGVNGNVYSNGTSVFGSTGGYHDMTPLQGSGQQHQGSPAYTQQGPGYHSSLPSQSHNSNTGGNRRSRR